MTQIKDSNGFFLNPQTTMSWQDTWHKQMGIVNYRWLLCQCALKSASGPLMTIDLGLGVGTRAIR